MRKYLLSLAVPLLLLSCGGYDSLGLSDKNSTEAKRYEIQKALDEGNYDFVIQALEEDPTYGGAFSEDEGRLSLAAAYVGKAGFDINGIIKNMIDAGDKGGDEFTTFVQALAESLGAKGTLYLNKAIGVYDSIATTCNPAPAEDIKRDACFYKGVISATNAATSVATIVKDVNKWLSPSGCGDDANGNGIGDEADATACAIEYAVNGSCSVSGATLTSLNPNLQFTDRQNNTYTFELVKIDISGGAGCLNQNTFYRLITTGTPRSVAVTEGFCDTSFNPCQPLDPSNGCYPCPVVEEENALDVVETIVNTIENSQDIITELVQGTDVEQAVNDFINEVCGADQQCTQEEIANYIQSQSQ